MLDWIAFLSFRILHTPVRCAIVEKWKPKLMRFFRARGSVVLLTCFMLASGFLLFVEWKMSRAAGTSFKTGLHEIDQVNGCDAG